MKVNCNQMKRNFLKEKSFDFAIKTVRLAKLLDKKREYVISKQLLCSGTAVGALIREAEFAESKADFAHKMNIALKEANETLYWLDLLVATEIISNKEIDIEIALSKELIAMLVSSLKTVRK